MKKELLAIQVLLSSKNGFALITALLVLLFVATIISLNFTRSGASKVIVSIEYQKAQIYFYEKSAKEIIESKLNNYDFSSSCLENLKLDFDEYLSIVQIFYIGKNLPCNSKYILDNNSSYDLNLTKIINMTTIVKEKNVSSFTRYSLD